MDGLKSSMSLQARAQVHTGVRDKENLFFFWLKTHFFRYVDLSDERPEFSRMA